MEAMQEIDIGTPQESAETELAKEVSATASESKDDILNSSDDGSELETDSGDETTDDDDEEDELQKFNGEQRQSLISAYHPEARADNFIDVQSRCAIRRDANGTIADEYHQTLPFMTKYEVTRILGMRASQLDDGAAAYIDPPPGIVDGYQIARQELLEKKVPFIIRRPLPDGKFEYWKAEDLEVLFPIASVAQQPNISIDSRS